MLCEIISSQDVSNHKTATSLLQRWLKMDGRLSQCSLKHSEFIKQNRRHPFNKRHQELVFFSSFQMVSLVMDVRPPLLLHLPLRLKGGETINGGGQKSDGTILA
ncbi:hypothetical protein CDAR_300051 [Caerostris darwini]|uniref:Uncharacterized protein n=1 Tax=Caerostris darwini TaxID=1538125 RepID=A0AAV4W5I4_9ARAC|nr:hypothetical protein CDAR_300051 [Caerostris darwini]